MYVGIPRPRTQESRTRSHCCPTGDKTIAARRRIAVEDLEWAIEVITRSTRQLGHGFDKHIEVGPDENFAEFLAEDLSQPKAASHSTDAAAMDALPHEHPKLSAIAMGSVSGQDFAAILDRAILRSRGNGRNVPQIDLKAEQESS